MIPFIPVVCVTPQDYKYVRAFLRTEGLDDADLDFPTLVAFSQDDGIIGVISTNVRDGLIVAGPLIVKSDKPRIMTLVRLIECYDKTLLTYGITRYIFSVNKANERWLDQIKRVYQIEPYAETEDEYHFLKVLT